MCKLFLEIFNRTYKSATDALIRFFSSLPTLSIRYDLEAGYMVCFFAVKILSRVNFYDRYKTVANLGMVTNTVGLSILNFQSI